MLLEPFEPPPTHHNDSAQAPTYSPAGAALWQQIDPAALPQVMLQAVATAPPGITITDISPELPLVYSNDAFTTITGYPPAEILGKNCRFLQGPDTDPRAITQLRQAIHAGHATAVVLRNYRSDGTPFWNEVSISPIRDQTDHVTHYIGTQIDVTERMQQK